MPRYRKKPVEIHAVQWDGGKHPDLIVNTDDLDQFMRTGDGKYRLLVPAGHGLIMTLEGPHIVSPGDYIVTGVAGEKYPVKPDIFHQTYDCFEWTDPDPEEAA